MLKCFIDRMHACPKVEIRIKNIKYLPSKDDTEDSHVLRLFRSLMLQKENKVTNFEFYLKLHLPVPAQRTEQSIHFRWPNWSSNPQICWKSTPTIFWCDNWLVKLKNELTSASFCLFSSLFKQHFNKKTVTERRGPRTLTSNFHHQWKDFQM